MNPPPHGPASVAPSGGIGQPSPNRCAAASEFTPFGTACAAPVPTAGGVRAPALIAVAHGSRDPRSAATMHAVVEQVAAARPDIDVRLAFLDLSTPSVDQVVDAIAAEGHSHALVAPLLLGSAFHARVDLPGLLAEARSRHPRLRLTQADVLGPDPRLVEALRDRVSESLSDTPPASVPRAFPGGPSPRLTSTWDRPLEALAAQGRSPHGRPSQRVGIAVAAVGSSSGAANARTARVAHRLTVMTGWDTEICFATTEPTVAEAVARLRARGADQVLVAPWFLAPGLLTDRLLANAPDLAHAEVIGAHPALTDIVWDRYDAAIAMPLTLSA
ncbi:sirohydrochlorin chelatase [Nocardia uniformis]|uniref:Sirohydrochlorin chelatase n=1 Tax=Nocardia uniformis TaxID=53432 RepID=A0A849CHD4_9NOCA|nr:sirohydrochlorin chelatase [Nocardia uniformis]NNH73051.1 sirohydrochlorin chelatase [Nocardia uniformis]